MINKNLPLHLTVAIAAFFVLCLATASVLAAPLKNILLVHGAWADGSGWRGVYDILVKDGYNVSIVQEPETSFQEDVAATNGRRNSTTPAHSMMVKAEPKWTSLGIA